MNSAQITSSAAPTASSNVKSTPETSPSTLASLAQASLEQGGASSVLGNSPSLLSLGRPTNEEIKSTIFKLMPAPRTRIQKLCRLIMIMMSYLFLKLKKFIVYLIPAAYSIFDPVNPCRDFMVFSILERQRLNIEFIRRAFILIVDSKRDIHRSNFPSGHKPLERALDAVESCVSHFRYAIARAIAIAIARARNLLSEQGSEHAREKVRQDMEETYEFLCEALAVLDSHTSSDDPIVIQTVAAMYEQLTLLVDDLKSVKHKNHI